MLNAHLSCMNIVDRVLQKHQGLMDFFMEHEDMCTVSGLWQLENAPHNQQAEYVQQCFAKLESFQNLLLQYSQEQIFPLAFFDD